MSNFADTVYGAPGHIQLDLAIISRQGGRNYNEDACGHWHSDHHLACVVADGAGGHGGGDIASKLAVRHIIERNAQVPVHSGASVHELILDTNRTIHEHRQQGGVREHMHSTVVALFIELDTQTALWATWAIRACTSSAVAPCVSRRATTAWCSPWSMAA